MFQGHSTEMFVIPIIQNVFIYVMICNEYVQTVSLFHQSSHLIYDEGSRNENIGVPNSSTPTAQPPYLCSNIGHY